MSSFEDFCPLTDMANLSATLDKYGVAVLPGVLPEEECDMFRANVFAYLTDEWMVYQPEDLERLGISHGGMLKYYGISLIKPVLDLKTDERLIEPFRAIWNETELTTSLDALFIGPPPQSWSGGRFFDINKLSFHTDQASHKDYMCCVQSFINLEDTKTGDGCLSVLVGSHKYHAEFFKHFDVTSKGRDWFLLNQTTHNDWFIKEKQCRPVHICAPKGSMVFFDSRTIHMGTLPRQDRADKERWRFLHYVCYTPARLQTAENARIKREAYEQNRTTNHWPYGELKLCLKRDTRYNDLANLTERHKKYLGITD